MSTDVPTATKFFADRDRPRRTSDLLRAGLHPRDLYALRAAGVIERVARGVYRLAEAPPMTEPDLVAVALRVPKAVVCLVSALHFHGMTAEIPHEVNIALPKGTSTPRLDWPPIRAYRFSAGAYGTSVETHAIDGVDVRVYSPVKSVADCFKFRNKLGTEIAVEALREGLRAKRFSPAELMECARVCRMANVIRPYAEALL